VGGLGSKAIVTFTLRKHTTNDAVRIFEFACAFERPKTEAI